MIAHEDPGAWDIAVVQSRANVDFCAKALRNPPGPEELRASRYVHTGWHKTEEGARGELARLMELWEAKNT